MFAAEVRKRRIDGMRSSHWRWHLDEVFVQIKGERHYLWRAVDHDGEVLESFVTRKRDKKAVLEFLRKAMKKHGRAESLVTDKLRSYDTAMKDLGVADRQATGGWVNNRAENSHLPFRRREPAMLRFRRMRSLQKFRLRPRLRLEPLQRRPQPLQPSHFQAEPRRRSCRVAGAWRRISRNLTVLGETGSNLSVSARAGDRAQGRLERMAHRASNFPTGIRSYGRKLVMP